MSEMSSLPTIKTIVAMRICRPAVMQNSKSFLMTRSILSMSISVWIASNSCIIIMEFEIVDMKEGAKQDPATLCAFFYYIG